MGSAQDKMDARAAIKQAEDEIAKENLDKAVGLLKAKLVERNEAQVVLDNLNREIDELKLRIEQGNI